MTRPVSGVDTIMFVEENRLKPGKDLYTTDHLNIYHLRER